MVKKVADVAENLEKTLNHYATNMCDCVFVKT